MAKISAEGGTNLPGGKVVDINHALHRDLTQVPGIGKVMAARIIAGRPYNRLEDMTRIQGIGQSFLDSLRPYLTLSSAPVEVEAGQAASAVSPSLEVDIQPTEAPEKGSVMPPFISELDMETHSPGPESEPVIILPAPGILEATRPENPPVEVVQSYESEEDVPLPPRQMVLRQSQPTRQAAAPQSRPAPAHPFFSRNETLAMVVGAALLAVLVGVGLTLGILALTNRGLTYASSGQAEALTRQLDELDGKMTSVGQDIASLRTRLDTLETVSGRLNNLEKEVGTMQQTLDEQAKQFKQAQDDLNQVKEQAANLEKHGQVFDSFLEGLLSLMSNVLPPLQR